MSIAQLLGRIALYILNPLILLGFVFAILVFFWGIFKFVANAGDPKAQAEGKENLKWGLVGLFIMVSVFAIIRLILGTFNLTNDVNNNPYANSLINQTN